MGSPLIGPVYGEAKGTIPLNIEYTRVQKIPERVHTLSTAYVSRRMVGKSVCNYQVTVSMLDY